jgi:hypothetical protein
MKSLLWKFIRKERLKYDKYTCLKCHNASHTYLTVHKEFRVRPVDWGGYNPQVSNLATLCRSCHTKLHQKRIYWQNRFGIFYSLHAFLKEQEVSYQERKKQRARKVYKEIISYLSSGRPVRVFALVS